MTDAFIYCRVSTDGQETERQLQELRKYCKDSNTNIVAEYQEHISGTKSIKHRKHLIEKVKESKAKYFIFHDYSRFSRNVKVALMMKDALHEIGVCLVSMQTNLRSLNEDGTPNSTANLVFTQLLAVYEMENETKRASIKSGLRIAVQKGKVLGRPKGVKEDRIKKYPKIVSLIKEQEQARTNGRKYLSVRKLATYTNTHKSLIQNIKADMKDVALI
jgi:DNA invertase Pin-like site-specific DNA recombinase